MTEDAARSGDEPPVLRETKPPKGQQVYVARVDKITVFKAEWDDPNPNRVQDRGYDDRPVVVRIQGLGNTGQVRFEGLPQFHHPSDTLVAIHRETAQLLVQRLSEMLEE